MELYSGTGKLSDWSLKIAGPRTAAGCRYGEINLSLFGNLDINYTAGVKPQKASQNNLPLIDGGDPPDYEPGFIIKVTSLVDPS